MGTSLLVVVHDISSAQRLLDMVKLVYSLGFNQIVVTKAYGAAASSGIPDAMRLALRLNRSIYVLPSVKDAVEVFSPDKIVIISREYGEAADVDEIVSRLGNANKPMIIFGGSDPAPGKDIAGLGEALYPRGFEARAGPVAEAAIILYRYKSLLTG
ncbi:RecB-family nuclease [Pyrofollis japonicus]|uniref:RecB-family nuclease n=1 Tax=Pyrofollis japonicus TaxID=3060460 RepID=UPI00295C02F5|nr:RecB-family nuclease [Pyrofollis japonicus]BEP17114.1 RecB-family nuclease [Pyrofollis japonicus]